MDRDFAEPLFPAHDLCLVSDAEGRCLTCSDEATPAIIVDIDSTTMLAIVLLNNIPTEIDVSLIDHASPGDTVLVHGGTALARL
jgi:hypothetical protein